MKTCSKCNIEKPKNMFYKLSRAKDGLDSHCKECETRRCRAYYALNRDKVRKRHTKYEKERLETDLSFKLMKNLRSRVSMAIRKTKSGSSIKDLGCTIDTLKLHLEKQFSEGMTWDNYGEWHIDHIKPLTLFDLTNRSEFKRAVHYTNLQPLWAKENLIKGARYVG